MAVWKRIKNFIFGSGEQALVVPDALVFNSINTDEILRQLDIINKATLNGQNNQPSSLGKQLDSVEDAIHEEVMNVVRPMLQNYDSQQRAYKERQISLHPSTIVNKFHSEASELVLQLKLKVNQATNELYLVRDALTNIERDWTNFKEKWNVSTDPVVKFSFMAKCLLLGALIVGESFLNASLIGPYASGGWLEGLGIAIIFPVVTLIGCAYPAGVFLRMFYRPGKFFIRILYLIVALISVIPALLSNLLLAYIRQFITEDGEWEAGYTIWLNLFSGEFSPIGLVSFLLFVFSTVLFVIAVIDIYRMDHPVPGLLNKFQERNNQHQKYQKKLNKIHEEILELRQLATQKIGGSHTLFNACQMEYSRVVNEQVGLWNKLQGYIQHVEVVMNRLFGIYRETNRKNRTSDDPQYFKDRWTFPLVDYKNAIVTSDTEAYLKAMAGAQEEIKSIQASLTEEFAKIPEITSNIDSIILEAKKQS